MCAEVGQGSGEPHQIISSSSRATSNTSLEKRTATCTVTAVAAHRDRHRRPWYELRNGLLRRNHCTTRRTFSCRFSMC